MKYVRKINGIPTKEYAAWKAMKARCYSPCNKKMGKYQSLGIEVCDKWINSYENFIDDMGISPDKNHSIDRINSNGNYSPKNCRWADKTVQANNRGEFNCIITYNNETHTLKEWSKIIDIKYNTLYYRVCKRKLPFEKAILKDPFEKTYKLNDEKKTLKEWTLIYDIKYSMAYDRLKAGWNLRDALTKPKSK